MIIHCYSPNSSVFCTGQIDELNGNVVGITIPAISKCWMVLLISTIPPRMQYCFWFTSVVDRSGSSGFYSAFPTTFPDRFTVTEQTWGLCQLLSMSIPLMHSGTKEIITRWVQGSSMRPPPTKTADHLTSFSLHSDW